MGKNSKDEQRKGAEQRQQSAGQGREAQQRQQGGGSQHTRQQGQEQGKPRTDEHNR